jgi:hypothetical protein
MGLQGGAYKTGLWLCHIPSRGRHANLALLSLRVNAGVAEGWQGGKQWCERGNTRLGF